MPWPRVFAKSARGVERRRTRFTFSATQAARDVADTSTAGDPTNVWNQAAHRWEECEDTMCEQRRFVAVEYATENERCAALLEMQDRRHFHFCRTCHQPQLLERARQEHQVRCAGCRNTYPDVWNARRVEDSQGRC